MWAKFFCAVACVISWSGKQVSEMYIQVVLWPFFSAQLQQQIETTQKNQSWDKSDMQQ